MQGDSRGLAMDVSEHWKQERSSSIGSIECIIVISYKHLKKIRKNLMKMRKKRSSLYIK